MESNRSISSSFKKLIITSAALALIVGFLPGSAQAVETVPHLGSASTYGALASAAITNTGTSSISGTAGGDIGVGGGTAPSGGTAFSGVQVLGGSSLTALLAGSAVLADSRGGSTTGVELGAGRTITPGAYTNPLLQSMAH